MPRRVAPVDDELRSIGAHEIHLRVERRELGRPLLLLNGLTRPLECWDPLVEALGDRCVIRFDPPGIGLSPSPWLPLSIRALADVAVGVLDAVEAPVADVLGYSHGGAIAQEMSHRAPDRVASLILAATSCGIGSVTGGFKMLTTMIRPEKDARGAKTRTPPLAIFYRSLALSCWTSVPFLGSIRQPTLVLSGDSDQLVPPINSRILAERIPNASALEFPAGHDLQHPRCAPVLAGIISDFLGRPP
jgi:pimeloyl-ACP methyl ester carboxylesterase